jgi:hypothetical protein
MANLVRLRARNTPNRGVLCVFQKKGGGASIAKANRKAEMEQWNSDLRAEISKMDLSAEQRASGAYVNVGKERIWCGSKILQAVQEHELQGPT